MSVRKGIVGVLIAALIASFALLWIAEGVGDTQPFDQEGLVTIHRYVGTGALQRGFAELSMAGYFGDYAWLLGAVLLAFVGLRWLYDAVRLIFGYVGAEMTDLVAKHIAHRPRPIEPWTLTHPHDSSFPSGHAVASVAVFVFITVLVARHLVWPWRGVLVTIGVVFALLLAFSRLVLAVHYPSDVLAGVVVGFIWMLLSFVVPLPR